MMCGKAADDPDIGALARKSYHSGAVMFIPPLSEKPVWTAAVKPVVRKQRTRRETVLACLTGGFGCLGLLGSLVIALIGVISLSYFGFLNQLKRSDPWGYEWLGVAGLLVLASLWQLAAAWHLFKGDPGGRKHVLAIAWLGLGVSFLLSWTGLICDISLQGTERRRRLPLTSWQRSWVYSALCNCLRFGLCPRNGQ